MVAGCCLLFQARRRSPANAAQGSWDGLGNATPPSLSAEPVIVLVVTDSGAYSFRKTCLMAVSSAREPRVLFQMPGKQFTPAVLQLVQSSPKASLALVMYFVQPAEAKITARGAFEVSGALSSEHSEPDSRCSDSGMPATPIFGPSSRVRTGGSQSSFMPTTCQSAARPVR